MYRGEVSIGEQQVPLQRMAILKKWPGADGVKINAGVDARFILVAGRPLGETIAQYGPFVMNSQEQIFQAIDDFRRGRLVETISSSTGQGVLSLRVVGGKMQLSK